MQRASETLAAGPETVTQRASVGEPPEDNEQESASKEVLASSTSTHDVLSVRTEDELKLRCEPPVTETEPEMTQPSQSSSVPPPSIDMHTPLVSEPGARSNVHPENRVTAPDLCETVGRSPV